MDNYIDIERKERFTTIYRYTTVNRVLTLIDKNQNVLVSPRKWEDPFENIINRMKFKLANGRIFKHPLRERAYGQCWTITEETDAAWRMYIPGGNGVRLKSTIQKLYLSLFQAQKRYPISSCFIGRVQYKTEDDLSSWFSDSNWVKKHFFNVGSKGQSKSFLQANSLLFKRKEFESEQEIRLLYLDPHNEGSEDIYCHKINVSDVIEEITFDPRMKEDLYETLHTVLVKLGYTGIINKSKLYHIPDYVHDF